MKGFWQKYRVQSIFYMRVFIVFMAALLLGCQSSPDSDRSDVAPYEYQVPEQIDDGWPTADLASKGVDVSLIEEMINSIKRGNSADIHSILIVIDGELVLEEYFPGYKFVWGNYNRIWTDFNRDTLHYVASSTKSFASALIGIALDQGLIDSVEENLNSFFPAYADFIIFKKINISLHHALTMTEGSSWDESGSPTDYVEMIWSNDWYAYVLNKSVFNEPGTVFNYNSGMSTLLAGVIQHEYNASAELFADEYLFKPLGIRNYRWYTGYPIDAPESENILGPNGELPTGSGLRMRPRDMAKFGQLFLNKGLWNGERLISEAWIEQSTSKKIDLIGWYIYDSEPGVYPLLTGYGYQWWRVAFRVGDDVYETYMSWGHGGQHIVVFDELNMVLVLTAGDYNWRANHISRKANITYLNDVILPAILEAN